MDGSVGFLVDGWVVLGVAVCPFVTAFIPVVVELLLRFLAASHHNQRSMDLVLRETMAPMVVELSVWMGVHGCDQPILMRV
jgi:hypothetical protein